MTKHKCYPFRSPLGEYMASMLDEKRAAGFKMNVLAAFFHRMDRFLVSNGLDSAELPENLARLWMTRSKDETAYGHYRRVGRLRQFVNYLHGKGVHAYLPETPPSKRSNYAPYIFTRSQIRDMLDAAERIMPHPAFPERQFFIPMVLRILYGCGLRVNEAFSLTHDDVDVRRGILTIREAKFRKERLVPVTENLRLRLQHYTKLNPLIPGLPYLFAMKYKRAYCSNVFYRAFRRIIAECGISHDGRGKGPRVHDLRHTFAVHRLEDWYRRGGDLAKQLPILSAYLGHSEISGTIDYLHITISLLPDITHRMEEVTGSVIPREGTR